MYGWLDLLVDRKRKSEEIGIYEDSLGDELADVMIDVFIITINLVMVVYFDLITSSLRTVVKKSFSLSVFALIQKLFR